MGSWVQDDGTSATDGDEDIAYVLLLGGSRGWETSAAATSLIGAIWSNDVTGSRIKLGSNYDAAFIGPLGIAAKSTGHTVLLDNAFRSTLDILESPRFNRVYYNTSSGLISLLEMSGNVSHL